MKSIINEKKCTGCMACVNACHFNAIKIEEGKDGFEYPVIDESKCKKCNLCKKVCPVLKIENLHCEEKVTANVKNKEKILQVYACKNKDESIRIKSSSGGIFSEIAQYILNQDGVVFGAKFDENKMVVHSYITKTEELEVFRGAKYVQSKIGKNYQVAKQFLDEGRKVLFSGTPCQIEGLLSYLGKDYKNLYTQDIICHGVPSPKVWKKYLEYKEKTEAQNIESINFRKKDNLGWQNYEVEYVYSSRKKENIYHKEDEYMKLFLQNLILRSSCYNCNFKKTNRNSDITLADFWGIQKVNLKFADEKGVSAVIIHSVKGKEMFEKIKEKIEFTKANIEDIIKYNSCINTCASYNEKRDNFFENSCYFE